MTSNKEQERRKTLQAKYMERHRTLQDFIDYILRNVDDYQSDEVQRRVNEIERLYWEAFDKYND